ncbi:MAG TPA: Npt1/Npt2 family nucleotide transporter [Candidatus Limnocylindria bacterium]|nr:Npt1/Npt2 family nucleotide transporter [Candidatus Limnocylindria bacterium]
MSARHINGYMVDAPRSERYYWWLKLFLITAAFFCVIGSYTVAKELKTSVFAYMVGRKYIPLARILTWLVLVPAIFVYARLVDRLHRYQLLCLYSVLYAVVGLVVAYLLGDAISGVSSVNSGPYHIFGWLFYFFVEGYSPFLVGVFWAFANSISSPEEAQRNYGFMVCGSKIGGVLTAGLAMFFLQLRNADGQHLYSDVLNHQILLASSSLLLLVVPLVIFCLRRVVPFKYLHGYEAAYQLEKHNQQTGQSQTGVFSGIMMFIKYPYVMGIFGITFCYEVVSTVLSYLTVEVAQETSSSMSETLHYLLNVIFWTHLSGFFISLFGTTILFNVLGTRRCLMLIPISAGILLLYFMMNINNANALLFAFVTLRSIYYAFTFPLRESLYIPTVKTIKFKSKSWIDAFGSKLGKSTGGGVAIVADLVGPAFFYSVYAFSFTGIVGLWLVVAWLLGRRFEQAVAKSEVIGSE